MRFRYSYQDHDGRNREDAVSAPSQSEAYAVLRKRGIRPMRVWPEKGELLRRRALRSLLVFGLLAALAGLLALTFRSGARAGRDDAAARVAAVAANAATPLPRRAFALPSPPVDFAFRADVVLARFARPGVPVELSPDETDAFVSDIAVALRHTIPLDAADSPEAVLLKRIVAGLHEEARIALGCGESPEAVLARFVERQRMEAAYRAGVLRELRAAPPASETETRARLDAANATLRLMGLAEIDSL